MTEEIKHGKGYRSTEEAKRGLEAKCGVCGFPIKKSHMVRHFGFFIAHLEAECIRLTLAEIERLKAEVKAVRRQLEEAHNG